jgi:hypothetical protein
MLRISRVAEQLLSSQDGVNSMQLVGWLAVRVLINRKALTFVDEFMALHYTVTSALLAVRCMQIFPMNQYA